MGWDFSAGKAHPLFAAVLAISGMPVAISGNWWRNRRGWFTPGHWAGIPFGLFDHDRRRPFDRGCAHGRERFLAEHAARDMAVYTHHCYLGTGVFFSCVKCCGRGYFQGLQYMVPSAVSQVVDQVVRVVATILLAYWLLPYGISFAVAGTALGSLVGEFAGWLVLVGFMQCKVGHFF